MYKRKERLLVHKNVEKAANSPDARERIKFIFVDCLDVDEKDVVVFEKEEDLKEMWNMIGLKRG